ncbi:MAG: hypothetical protein ACM32E_00270, partial [Gemmatimonadota bacterium]
VDTIGRSFGWLLVLFFVPSLPVRYGLNFGAAPVAAAVALVLLVAAGWLGAREALAAAPGRRAAWAGQMALTLAVGLAGALAARELPARYSETRLLWEAAAFFLCAVGACALLDRVVGSSAGR